MDLEEEFLEIKSKKDTKAPKEKWYEFEIYMAQKCANISELYAKLEKILLNPKSTIDGYSLYEVKGGNRGKIKLPRSDNTKWKELGDLKKYLESKGIKDIVRPLITSRNKYVVYDETSIILRIIAKEKSEITRWEESTSEVRREIKEIFEKIKENETSVFFTVKKLEYVGNF